jgi:hypothetical protein
VNIGLKEIQIAQNLLEGKVCDTCYQLSEYTHIDRLERACRFYFGEAVGWQWKDVSKEGTCEYWGQSEKDHLAANI